jgi:hypothetical protein
MDLDAAFFRAARGYGVRLDAMDNPSGFTCELKPAAIPASDIENRSAAVSIAREEPVLDIHPLPSLRQSFRNHSSGRHCRPELETEPPVAIAIAKSVPEQSEPAVRHGRCRLIMCEI